MGGYGTKALETRLSRRRGLALAGSAAAGGALLAACGGGSSSKEKADHASLVTPAVDESKQAKRGGVWLDSQTADFVSFDPHFTALPHPSRFLFSTLMRIKPGWLEPAKGDYMLDAASGYEISPDKLQLTMKLRPNHKWHNVPPVNGRQVEADDVVFSYERLIKQGSNRGNFAAALGGPIEPELYRLRSGGALLAKGAPGLELLESVHFGRAQTIEVPMPTIGAGGSSPAGRHRRWRFRAARNRRGRSDAQPCAPTVNSATEVRSLAFGRWPKKAGFRGGPPCWGCGGVPHIFLVATRAEQRAAMRSDICGAN